MPVRKRQKSRGRQVGLALDISGKLVVADDVGNTVGGFGGG
jgi:hypothetical protein